MNVLLATLRGIIPSDENLPLETSSLQKNHIKNDISTVYTGLMITSGHQTNCSKFPTYMSDHNAICPDTMSLQRG